MRGRGAGQPGLMLLVASLVAPANAIEPLFKGMNDYVRRNRELSRSDPAESLRLGLLHAGEHAFKYVQQSEKDVEGWLDGRGLYNA